jgi:hypothetical protein
MAFQLPLVLTCEDVEMIVGGPMVLDCVVKDAAGEAVRSKGHLRINVSPKSTFEDVSSILQSQANALAKDLLRAGQAERVEKTEEERTADLSSIKGKSFLGVAK